MKKEEELNWIGGKDDFDLILQGDKKLDNDLTNIALQFFKQIVVSAQKYKDVETGKIGLVDTGDLTNEKNFRSKLIDDGVEIYMLYYALFLDQGVQGVIDNSNAPNSPYKFKNFGMPEAVRKKMIKYVQRNKSLLKDETKSGYGKLGLENKASDKPDKKDINEMEAQRMIYLIKAYGIKETAFIRTAWKQATKDVKPIIKKAALDKIKFFILNTQNK